MPVPVTFADISETASANSPQGSESVGPNMNAYIQAAYAYAKQLYDGQMNPSGPVSLNSQKLTNVASGTVNTDGVNYGQMIQYVPLAGGTMTGALTIQSTATGALAITSNAATGANIKLTDASTSTNKYIRCLNNNIQFVNGAYNQVPMTMDDVGNVTFAGNITSSSDKHLKKHVRTIEGAVAKVQQLRGVTYATRKKAEAGVRRMGLLAQDVQKVAPEAVGEDASGYLTVAYGNLVGLLVEAVKELADEVAELRAAK